MRKIMDTGSLKHAMSAGSDWAQQCGRLVHERRETLGISVRQLSAVVDVPVQTIYRVESGDIIARDYLRLSLAHALVTDSSELFPMPTREMVAEYMDVAA